MIPDITEDVSISINIHKFYKGKLIQRNYTYMKRKTIVAKPKQAKEISEIKKMI